jgi:hypothetical protein
MKKHMESLIHFCKVAKGSYCYNEAAKAEYKQAAMGVLKKLAGPSCLNLPKGSYSIRFNAGGPAIWGEATLHSNEVYMQIAVGACGPTPIMYRTCDGQKDYHGGNNCWVRLEMLEERGYSELLTAYKCAQQDSRKANLLKRFQ